ncbi:hypothetical protein ACQPZJ_20690 [Actinoplanes sp. CA-054009]
MRLLATSAAAYFGSLVLMGIALVPAAFRSYQLFSRDDNGLLELLVELLRVVLVAAMIVIGRGWRVADLFHEARWREVGDDVSRTVGAGWAPIAIRLAVVLVVVIGLNALTAAVVGEGPAADAALFAVKNFVLIPVVLMAVLQGIGVTTRESGE